MAANKFCSECGAQIAPESNFCGGCGAAVSTASPAMDPRIARAIELFDQAGEDFAVFEAGEALLTEVINDSGSTDWRALNELAIAYWQWGFWEDCDAMLGLAAAAGGEAWFDQTTVIMQARIQAIRAAESAPLDLLEGSALLVSQLLEEDVVSAAITLRPITPSPWAELYGFEYLAGYVISLVTEFSVPEEKQEAFVSIALSSVSIAYSTREEQVVREALAA